MLHIEEINTFEEFLKLEPIWNDLLAKSNVDFPFLTFEWLKSWWQSYGKKSTLFILIVRDENEIVGIAPLMRAKIKFRGIPVNAVTFIANYHSNRSGFIMLRLKREIVNSVLRYLTTSKLFFDVICLDFLLYNSDTEINIQKAINELGLMFIKKRGSSSPFIPVEQNWELYLRTLSQKFRYNLRRYEKRLKLKFDFDVKMYSNEDIDIAMDDLLTVSSKTWKSKTKTAIASNEDNKTFYYRLAKLASLNNWLNIWLLKTDNKPIAFTFNINYKNKVYVLKNGYNEEYSEFAPSKILSFFAIKDSFDKNIAEYEWLGDKEPFKLDWSLFCKDHYKFWIFRKTIIGKVLFFNEKWIVPLTKSFINITKPKQL